MQKEKHISVVAEPGSVYLDHVRPTCENGSADCIANSVYSSLIAKRDDGTEKVCLNTLSAVGSYGERTNAGREKGVCRMLELFLKKPLQRIVCQLHFNELPLRHVFALLDGKTSGPKSFDGPIGKQLASCEQLPVTEFEAIECDFTSLEDLDGYDDLNTDQKYLFKMVYAVASGFCSPELAALAPGHIHHARWLTLACRCLRLYVSTSEPSNELLQIVTFIVRVYSIMWFRIKKHSKVTDAAPNLWNTILAVRYLPEHLKTVVHRVIQSNGFYAHSESLLQGVSKLVVDI